MNEAVYSFAVVIEQDRLNLGVISIKPLGFFLSLLQDLPLLLGPPLANKTIIHNKNYASTQYIPQPKSTVLIFMCKIGGVGVGWRILV